MLTYCCSNFIKKLKKLLNIKNMFTFAEYSNNY